MVEESQYAMGRLLVSLTPAHKFERVALMRQLGHGTFDVQVSRRLQNMG